jgi:hypothetical protein
LISWKHSFKLLKEEYDIAKKKKQALDKLYESGRISQSTRDSFDNELVSAIADIEKQQKDLLAKMEAKVSEFRGQIQTLEMLLASYEIQHVVGEIDEDTYQHEIMLLSTGLETAKHELDAIKEAAIQLCPAPAAPATEPTAVAEVVAPAPEPEAAPTPPVEAVPAAPAEVEFELIPAVEVPPLCTQEPVAAMPEPVPEQVAVESPPEPIAEPVVAETPVEKAEAVTEPAAENIVEAPMETTETVAETPVETATEPPTEATPETSAETATETPVEIVVETPAETVENIVEKPAETIAENAVETIVEGPQETAPAVEAVVAPETPQPVEGELVEAHPTEAPKEAHPEVLVEAAGETENAEESKPTVTEASSEENSEEQNS